VKNQMCESTFKAKFKFSVGNLGKELFQFSPVLTLFDSTFTTTWDRIKWEDDCEL